MDPNELLRLVSLDRVARTEKTQTHPKPGICFLSTAFLTTPFQRHRISWNGGVRCDVHSLFDQFQSAFDPFERSGGDPLPLIQVVDELSTGDRLHPMFSPNNASPDGYLLVQQILHPNRHDPSDHRSPPGHHPPHRHQTGAASGQNGAGERWGRGTYNYQSLDFSIAFWPSEGGWGEFVVTVIAVVVVVLCQGFQGSIKPLEARYQR